MKPNLKKMMAAAFTFLLIQGVILGGEVSEYKVKAAYLFNFAKFVVWPQGTFTDEKAPLVIGVLGEDPFEGELDDIVQGKTINQRTIRLVRYRTFEAARTAKLKGCQILFIAYSEKGRLKEILASLNGSGVLTVSEIESFPLMGGCILFDQVGKRIGLVVNPRAARSAGIEISAKLLQVSKIYKSE